ncbi:ephrin-B3 isoform X2 [Drosophila mojavensis]|uniref:ephrin-B3 isoform X2 n=1 Tax=Drosophila mojavensis TaxID=7230 RepID=UPI001CD0C838|nr:ephrin-B3 isoform X2 [Drosophila mojavensis]
MDKRFRIDNTDHIIDVNKGNLAFEFDQVHIICPVYEPGAFDNETEKYIIYNVSKVEYETCRITNADPRVIAICDKPQKLMFFTITFRPFTPQPGGLEFLPGNDYYFISTSSKDDLYRRIGGRCSTNNMKVVFKVCCAPEDKNKTTEITTMLGNVPAVDSGGTSNIHKGVDNAAVNIDPNRNMNSPNGIHTIGVGVGSGSAAGGGGQMKPVNGAGTSINTNIDQFNRIPIQPNLIAGGGGAVGTGVAGGSGIMHSPGHGSINMLPPGRGGIHMPYPNHHHIQTGIRINNVPTQQNNQHPHHKGNLNNMNSNDDHHNYDKHPNEVVKNEELTYNSGSGQATLNRPIDVYLWSWSWLPGGTITTTILIAAIFYTFHYLFWTLNNTMARRIETLGIYR